MSPFFYCIFLLPRTRVYESENVETENVFAGHRVYQGNFREAAIRKNSWKPKKDCSLSGQNLIIMISNSVVGYRNLWYLFSSL